MTTIGTFLIMSVIVLVVFFFGYAIGKLNAKIDGILIVDDSDEERTRWVFDMKKDPSDIKKQTYVRFKIVESK